jgi:hypothetical protein
MARGTAGHCPRPAHGRNVWPESGQQYGRGRRGQPVARLRGSGGALSKFAKGKSWIEHRVSSDMELDGGHWTVNLVARKGTGVQGYRVTLVFLPHAGGADVEAVLPNAASTADVHRVSRELTDDPARVAALFREARRP